MREMKIPLGDRKRLKKAVERLQNGGDSLYTQELSEKKENERNQKQEEAGGYNSNEEEKDDDEERLKKMEAQLQQNIGDEGSIYNIDELVALGQKQQMAVENHPGKHDSDSADNYEKTNGILAMLKSTLLNMLVAVRETKPGDIKAFIGQVQEVVNKVRDIGVDLTAVPGLQPFRPLILAAHHICYAALEHVKEDVESLLNILEKILAHLHLAVEYLEKRFEQWSRTKSRETVNCELEEPLQDMVKTVGSLIGGGVLGGFLAVGAATAILPLLGFTASGITAGSAAASLMASYGGAVGASSLCAVCWPCCVVINASL